MTEPRPEYRPAKHQSLSQLAEKLARRLEALPVGRCYSIILVKGPDGWVFSVTNPQGSKAELIS